MTGLKLVPALGSYGPGDRNRRDGTSEGVAVAAISRRSGKQAAVSTLQGAPFGVPPPSLVESEVPRTPHSREGFCGQRWRSVQEKARRDAHQIAPRRPGERVFCEQPGPDEN